MPSDPQDINSVDNEAELFRETLLMMRIYLKSDELMHTVVKTLKTILQNIVNCPEELKF